MTDVERFVLEACERVKQHSLDNVGDFTAGSIQKIKMDLIKAEIVLLNGYMADQVTGGGAAKGGFDVKGTSRKNMFAIMQKMSDTAKVMEPAFDGIADEYKMPSNRSDQNMLATARSWYASSLARNANFIAYNMDSDFRTVLNDAADAFEASFTAPITAVGQRTAARALIAASIARCKAALEILDGTMRNLYATQPGKLAAWNTASHIERPKKKAPPTPTP